MEMGHAEVVELGREPRHRDLALVVLSQHVAFERRAEMPLDPSRQRCHQRLAVGGEPALAAEADHLRADDQFLHDEVFVALEARTGRHLDRDHPRLVHDELGPFALPPLGPPLAPWLGRLLHAAGPELRPALQALEPGDLLAQCDVIGAQRGDPLEQLDDQLPQFVEAKIIDIWWRFAHAASESQP